MFGAGGGFGGAADPGLVLIGHHRAGEESGNYQILQQSHLGGGKDPTDLTDLTDPF
jgi:hypothetical protein